MNRLRYDYRSKRSVSAKSAYHVGSGAAYVLTNNFYFCRYSVRCSCLLCGIVDKRLTVYGKQYAFYRLIILVAFFHNPLFYCRSAMIQSVKISHIFSDYNLVKSYCVSQKRLAVCSSNRHTEVIKFFVVNKSRGSYRIQFCFVIYIDTCQNIVIRQRVCFQYLDLFGNLYGSEFYTIPYRILT